MEKIVAAAIRYGDLCISMPAPNRHHHILRGFFALTNSTVTTLADQGFLTSTGRFVDRVEGRAIALREGQIKDVEILHSRHLFSEDLW